MSMLAAMAVFVATVDVFSSRRVDMQYAGKGKPKMTLDVPPEAAPTAEASELMAEPTAESASLMDVGSLPNEVPHILTLDERLAWPALGRAEQQQMEQVAKARYAKEEGQHREEQLRSSVQANSSTLSEEDHFCEVEAKGNEAACNSRVARAIFYDCTWVSEPGHTSVAPQTWTDWLLRRQPTDKTTNGECYGPARCAQSALCQEIKAEVAAKIHAETSKWRVRPS